MSVESSWTVMAHGDALEGKWRGNWRMEWGSQFSSHYRGTWCMQHYYHWWRTPRLPAVDSSVSPKDEIWFLRVFHHVSNAVYPPTILYHFNLHPSAPFSVNSSSVSTSPRGKGLILTIFTFRLILKYCNTASISWSSFIETALCVSFGG